MNCKYCDGDTAVKESIKFAGTVYRRRKCKECNKAFWTEEIEVENKYDIYNVTSYKRYKYSKKLSKNV